MIKRVTLRNDIQHFSSPLHVIQLIELMAQLNYVPNRREEMVIYRVVVIYKI